ncbi:MAG: anion transporter, partial [Acidobacteria bacterium]|nr:anion transporter [Acidobacteriota bacterium]
VALMGLALNHALLHLAFRKELRAATLTPSLREEPGTPLLGSEAVLTGLVLCAMVYAFFHGADLAWTSAAGFAALLVVHRAESRGLWSLIDWPVLLFFAGLFVVVEGLVASGAAAWALGQVPVFGAIRGSAADYVRLAAVFLVGSNVVSNVPFILVIRPEMAQLPNQALAWELLAMASTFAGNLTLLGSVANIIVAERSEKVGGLRFGEYLRTGLPLALATTAIGTLWLLWVHGVL